VQSGQALEKRYTVRTVELDLRPQDYDAKAVKATRLGLNASQALFAQILGVKPALVRAWEQGLRKPSQMACRLLDEINRDRERWLRELRGSIKQSVC
jgi:DNA-binding transcriptional regulator YiaG